MHCSERRLPGVRSEFVKAGVVLVWFASALVLHGETGYEAWLRYAPVDEPALSQYRQGVPAVITTSSNSILIRSARDELVRGMLGRTLRIETGEPLENAIVLRADDADPADSYSLRSTVIGHSHCILITGPPRGVLYGAFALLRVIALGRPITNLDEHDSPYAPIRWLNHWDNLNGTIERGYGGRSIFWIDRHARDDLSRVTDYARLLA